MNIWRQLQFSQAITSYFPVLHWTQHHVSPAPCWLKLRWSAAVERSPWRTFVTFYPITRLRITSPDDNPVRPHPHSTCLRGSPGNCAGSGSAVLSARLTCSTASTGASGSRLGDRWPGVRQSEGGYEGVAPGSNHCLDTWRDGVQSDLTLAEVPGGGVQGDLGFMSGTGFKHHLV